MEYLIRKEQTPTLTLAAYAHHRSNDKVALITPALRHTLDIHFIFSSLLFFFAMKNVSIVDVVEDIASATFATCWLSLHKWKRETERSN